MADSSTPLGSDEPAFERSTSSSSAQTLSSSRNPLHGSMSTPPESRSNTPVTAKPNDGKSGTTNPARMDGDTLRPPKADMQDSTSSLDTGTYLSAKALAAARRISPRRSHPHLPHSADSLLYHLHTDPSASHITLSNEGAPVATHRYHLGKQEKGREESIGEGAEDEFEGVADGGQELLDVGSSPPLGASSSIGHTRETSSTDSSEFILDEPSTAIHRRAKTASSQNRADAVLTNGPDVVLPRVRAATSTDDRLSGNHQSLAAAASQIHVDSLRPRSSNRPARINLPPSPRHQPFASSSNVSSNVSTPSPEIPDVQTAPDGSALPNSRDRALAQRDAQSMQSLPRLRTRIGTNPPGAKISARPGTAPPGFHGATRGQIPAQRDTTSRSHERSDGSDGVSEASEAVLNRYKTGHNGRIDLSGMTSDSPSGMSTGQSDSDAGASSYFEARQQDYPVVSGVAPSALSEGSSEHWPAEGESPGEGTPQDDILVPAVALEPTKGYPELPSAKPDAPKRSGSSPGPLDSGAARRGTITPRNEWMNRGKAQSTEPEADEEDQTGISCVDAFSQRVSEMVEAGMSQQKNLGPIRAGDMTIVGSAGSFAQPQPSRTSRQQVAPSHPGRKPGDEHAHASSLKYPGPADWSSFIQAYSEGRWDAAKVPQAPRPSRSQPHTPPRDASRHRSSLSIQRSATAALPKATEYAPTSPAASSSNKPDIPGNPFGLTAYLSNNGSGSTASQRTVSGSVGSARNSTVSLPLIPAATPDAFARDLRYHVAPLSPTIPMPGPSSYSHGESAPTVRLNGQTPSNRAKPNHIAFDPAAAGAAATVRLASEGFSMADLAPFGLPSPDRELVDPMSAAVTERAGRRLSSSSDSAVSPGGWPHLSSAKSGPAMDNLPTIAASPAGSPTNEMPPAQSLAAEGPAPRFRASLSDEPSGRFPPASAPLNWLAPGAASDKADYFGKLPARQLAMPPTPREPPSQGRMINPRPERIGGSESDFEDAGSRHSSTTSKPKLVAHSSHGSNIKPKSAVTAMFHREAPGSLNSQEVEMDPVLMPSLPQGLHEETFERLGFLPSVLPPDEAARRRALARYTVGEDMRRNNEALERLATLVKMVFQCKIVLLALIDDNEQWNIVDHGLGAKVAPRINSLCGHAILSKSEEPMVVLDTHLDWRFARNPNVVGQPGIRFYAGAPLRTADGYNIGSLCIIDTVARSEFPPRQRIILKEFAAIAIREMELSRDRVRLRARDRIQLSMEKFTRECLELDADSNVAGTSARMDRVHERAAKLVRKTLDVDGALVLDLSQIESVEVIGSDGQPSRAYQADPYDVDEIVDEHLQETYKATSGSGTTYSDQQFTFGPLPPWVVIGASEIGPIPEHRKRGAVGREHAKFSEFLLANPEGRIYEHVVPSWIRHVLPPQLQYAMLVPIFNIDKHPFALLCAYTCDKSKQFLEGFELQFLRAIGVVILSAVLKRRMALADKAKSNFISNISHELRTPLHGILAAAELLADTQMDSNQVAFLQTVQACGNSLIETVNHVLDFTKLSGAAKNSLESSIRPGRTLWSHSVNLAKLVEETVEGCWIGQRAKTFQAGSEIGTFYSPPTATSNSGLRRASSSVMPSVETVIDIGLREKGWQVYCEKGGIRRVLMNLIGNSLKFTTDGYVQIALRELAHTPGSKTIPIEVAVIDTGKGISRTFLKEQLFHPFSQENPLQTGTGLGLAIVNSIVRSDGVNGKVDVWSSEGLGTEIKVTFNVETEDNPVEDDRGSVSSGDSLFGLNYTISLINFRLDHRGANLNKDLIAGYVTWWGFEVQDLESDALGDIVISDEDDAILDEMVRRRNLRVPVLILSTSRSARQPASFSSFLAAGGFAQMVFKPAGPARLEAAIRACMTSLHHDTPSQSTTKSQRSDYFSPRMPPVHPARSPMTPEAAYGQTSQRLSLGRHTSTASSTSLRLPFIRPGPGSRQTSASSGLSRADSESYSPHMSFRRQVSTAGSDGPAQLQRRNSEQNRTRGVAERPRMAPRSTTYQDLLVGERGSTDAVPKQTARTELEEGASAPDSPNSTVSLADGGAMLKHVASAALPRPGRVPRVMLVDDNAINLQLLGAYLRKKKIPFNECINGKLAVALFRESPPGYWDIILMDISMPVMDGMEATQAVRQIEAERRQASAGIPASPVTPIGSETLGGHVTNGPQTSHIFALSGRATTEDKKRAFAVGVDG